MVELELLFHGFLLIMEHLDQLRADGLLVVVQVRARTLQLLELVEVVEKALVELQILVVEEVDMIQEDQIDMVGVAAVLVDIELVQ